MPPQDQSPTYAVVQTPPGRGAVAVILVSGPQAIDAVDAHFLAASGKPVARQPVGAIRFGHWASPTGEEIVVCHRNPQSQIQNPKSKIVEVHCHGGHAATAAILADLQATGCKPMNWPEWLRLMAADPLAAEAQIALAEAPTERTAAILLDQYHGALARAIRAVLKLIDDGNMDEAATEVDGLLSRAEVGLHLTSPWRVVLAGPPNVGKSSLINALVGYRRSIVFDQPGTTRDVVTARTAIDGWPVELADTAGLRAASDALEAAGVALATRTLQAADLVILVSDATQPPDLEVFAEPPTKRVLRVRNKIDLAASTFTQQPAIETSAVTGAGIDLLLNAISQVLAPEPPAPETAVPFTQPQQAALERARDAIYAGKVVAARGPLQALLASRAHGFSLTATLSREE